MICLVFSSDVLRYFDIGHTEKKNHALRVLDCENSHQVLFTFENLVLDLPFNCQAFEKKKIIFNIGYSAL